MDASSGRTHVQSSQINAKMTARNPEVISITLKEQKPPNSPVDAGSWCRNETDGSGNVADVSATRTEVHSDRNGARTTAKTHKTVSKTSNKPKPPNSPVGMKILCIGEADGWGNHADEPDVCRDMQHAGTNTKTTENANRKVKIRQRRSKSQNSPYRLNIETPRCPGQCEHVSNKGNNGYTPQNVPIKDLGTRIRQFAFGRPAEVLRSLEGVEASVEGEKDGGRDDGCGGDVDGTISSGDV